MVHGRNMATQAWPWRPFFRGSLVLIMSQQSKSSVVAEMPVRIALLERRQRSERVTGPTIRNSCDCLAGPTQSPWPSTKPGSPLAGRSDCRYFAIETDARTPIGNVWLWDICLRHRKAELRIVVGEPDSQGHGLGTAAIQRACEHAFRELGLHRIYAYVLAINPPRVAELRKGRLSPRSNSEGRPLDGRRFLRCLPAGPARTSGRGALSRMLLSWHEFTNPQLSASVQSLVRSAYGVLLLCLLADALRHGRRPLFERALGRVWEIVPERRPGSEPRRLSARHGRLADGRGGAGRGRCHDGCGGRMPGRGSLLLRADALEGRVARHRRRRAS